MSEAFYDIGRSKLVASGRLSEEEPRPVRRLRVRTFQRVRLQRILDFKGGTPRSIGPEGVFSEIWTQRFSVCAFSACGLDLTAAGQAGRPESAAGQGSRTSRGFGRRGVGPFRILHSGKGGDETLDVESH